MKEDFRNPKNKYLKIEDVIAMNIPLFTPIEIEIRQRCKDDVDRGDVLETKLGYYVGTAKKEHYDTLQYHGRLIDGKPVDSEQETMLPLIDSVKPLRRD